MKDIEIKGYKCPVCNCPMKQSTYDYETAEDPETWYCSYMPCDCVCSYGASKAVWEELTRTRKALGIAVDTLKDIEKTRCAVDTNLYAANHKLLNAGNAFCWTTIDEIHNALYQITALEQKDVK